MNAITAEELLAAPAGEYAIIDVREAGLYFDGHITGALNVPGGVFTDINFENPKKIVVYCNDGNIGEAVAENLTRSGILAYNLQGGYLEWLNKRPDFFPKDFSFKVEEGIRKRFHKKLFSKFAKAIVEYKLVEEGDKIAVCISGGKDSILMAKLFQELKRHNKFAFELVFLVMDPGYAPANRRLIENNARLLDIPITMFGTDIFENVFNIEKSPCYICARMRRGYLYSKAKELGCNKIALGHHYDDVIETVLMGMLYGGQMQTMMPRVDSAHFEGMRLIRPMYLIREKDIIAWRDYFDLRFIRCACKFTENYAQTHTGSKRQKVKNIIKRLAEEDPEIEQNIFKSAENVNLSTILAYKDKSGVKRWYYDEDE